MLHYFYSRLSVIRQKDESQNGCFKKTKQANFSEKRRFLTSWYAFLTPWYVLSPYYQGGLPLAKNKFWEPVTSDYISGSKTFLFGQVFGVALFET